MNINEDLIKNVINVDTSINDKSRVNFIKGKNLYNPSYRANDGTIKSSGGTGTESNGVFSITATRTDSYFWEVATQNSSYSNDKGELYEFKKDTYTISLSNTTFNNNFITYYDANKVSLGWNVFKNSTFTINKSDKTGAKYFTIRFGIYPASSGTTYSTTIQLQGGNQATIYEPYIAPSIVVDGEEIYVKRQDGIIESGSNANGNYIKFVDGTLICTIIKTINIAISTAWGSLYIGDTDTKYTYPIAFVGNNPVVNYSITGYNSAFVISWTQSGNKLVETDRFALVRGNTASAQDYVLNITAIGRWK